MKQKVFKRFSGILLALVMVIGMIPYTTLTVFAAGGTGAENDPYVATTYAELKELMENAPTDGTVRYIKLGNNIASEDINNDYSLTLTQAEQKVVLDLAGCNISRDSSITVDQSVIRAKKGNLTINDSVGTGGVYAKGKIPSAIGMTSTDLVGSDNGTIVINGGTFTAEYSLGQGTYIESGNLYINGGTFKGNTGLYVQCGQTYIYGGEFYTTKADGKAVMLAVDQNIEVYNLTAYGKIISNTAQADLWDYISKGNVYVDNVKQSKTSVNKFVGTVIRIETDVVDEINITITTPVVGNTIEKSADVPYGAGYEIVMENGEQVLSWFSAESIAEGTFERLTKYKVRLYVKVTDATAMDICAKVNGQLAKLEFQLESMEGDRYYWIEYTFPATEDNLISSANVTVPNPIAGENATAGIIYTSEKYNVSVGWSSTADGSEINNFNNKTFEAGKTYYADIFLVSEDPYIFTEGATVFVNSKAYTSTWTVGESYKKYVAVYDIPFTTSNTDTYTVSFEANGGSGTIAEDTDQLGGYILPDCGFTAPNGKQFLCWAEDNINGNRYAVGEEYNVTSNVTFYAVWEDIPVTNYMVSYFPTEGSGTMIGDVVEENGTFTLEVCTFMAPNGKQFKAWAIGSVNGEQKQPGEQITITGETYIYAIWEDIAVSNYTITATAGENGSITPSGEVSVAKGSSKTFTITADSGYHIKDVKINGTSIGVVSTYKFEDISDNATISVEFDEDTVPHTCNPNLVPKDEPNCTTAGKRAYYHCECGKNYEDAQGNTEIADIETWGTLNPLEHDYASAWSSDASGHWKICTRCSEKQNVSTHTAGDWIVDKEETETAVGSKHKECTVCGYKLETAEIPTTGTPHSHSYADTWSNDASKHWKSCECGEKSEEAAHTAGDWIVDKEATETAVGSKHKECTVCGYKLETAEIPKTGKQEETTPVPATKGKVITDKQGSRYKVTKSDAKNGEVTFVKPKSGVTGTVKIPDTVTIDGITYNVTAIEANAFKNNKNITKVIIGNNVTVIGKNAFAGCKKLSSVTVGKKVKTISAGAFSGCAKLKTVKLGSAVTTIGDKAFYKCTSLTSIAIPSKVTKIGKSAFEGCKKLKTITVKSTKLKSVGKKALKGIHAKAKIKVPKSKLAKYKSLFKNKGQGKNVKVTK